MVAGSQAERAPAGPATKADRGFFKNYSGCWQYPKAMFESLIIGTYEDKIFVQLRYK